MTPKFTIHHNAVHLGRVRFTPTQVEQLIRLFSREGAWDLFDDICAARDALVGGWELDTAA